MIVGDQVPQFVRDGVVIDGVVTETVLFVDTFVIRLRIVNTAKTCAI